MAIGALWGSLIWLVLLILLVAFVIAVSGMSVLKDKNKNFWLWYAVASLSFVLGFYLLMLAIASSNKRLASGGSNSASSSNLTELPTDEATGELNYYEFEPVDRQQFTQLTKVRGKRSAVASIDYYANLIAVMDDSNFQGRYVEAVKKNFAVKRKYYFGLLKDKSKELNQIQGQYVKTPYGSNQKDENVQSIKNLITEVTDIITTIDKTNYDTVIDNLRLAVGCKKRGLASLSGRDEIKQHICKQILAFVNNPIIFSSGHQNIILAGSPGSGKTTCATSLAFCYNKSGIFVRDRYYKISTNEILSAYVNESTNKTRNTFYSGLEGLILLDEAYQLVPKNPFDQTHADESIAEIVGLLHEYCGKTIFMMAGYETEMERVLSANQGLSRRFPHKIVLKPYNWQTLVRIFAAHVPTDVSLDTELLCSLVKDGVQNDVFVDQAGTIVNICNDFLTLYYSAAASVSSRTEAITNSAKECLVNAFNGYYPDYHVTL